MPYSQSLTLEVEDQRYLLREYHEISMLSYRDLYTMLLSSALGACTNMRTDLSYPARTSMFRPTFCRSFTRSVNSDIAVSSSDYDQLHALAKDNFLLL